ncbi:MAG: nucleoside hydrolase [Woeseiaceae bacterium]
MKKVIFDTDIGIDDAMALLFLHYSPEVELKAIVSGFGNADIETTTRNALYMKEHFEIDAPVYRGAAEPIGDRLGHGYPDFVHGDNGLGEIDIHEPTTQVESLSGAQAIVDIVRECPQEISIVAVGRLTNLALALELCPELPNLVREVIVMGGTFGHNGHCGNVSPVAEANIAGDPQAADKVFASGLTVSIVGLDVTEETIANDSFFETLQATTGKPGDFIYRISRFYLRFHEQISGAHSCPIHDSSAVAYLLRPNLYQTKTAAVRVVTTGIAIGQTIAGNPDANFESDAWKNKPVCKICVGVEPDKVLALYTNTLALAAE